MRKGRSSGRTFRKGEVWWGEINAGMLGEHLEKKRRPYVVVSRNSANKHSPNVTVVPCSCHSDPYFPAHARVWIKGAASSAMCEQVITVSKSRFYKRECMLSKQEVKGVMDKLKIHFGMEV